MIESISGISIYLGIWTYDSLINLNKVLEKSYFIIHDRLNLLPTEWDSKNCHGNITYYYSMVYATIATSHAAMGIMHTVMAISHAVWQNLSWHSKRQSTWWQTDRQTDSRLRWWYLFALHRQQMAHQATFCVCQVARFGGQEQDCPVISSGKSCRKMETCLFVRQTNKKRSFFRTKWCKILCFLVFC